MNTDKSLFRSNQLEKAKKILKEAERYNPDKGNILIKKSL